MARSQGLRVLSRVREDVSAGEMPAGSLLDGVMILIASALLVTPGVLTDAFGFLCLIPAFRARVKRELMRRIERAVEEGRLHVVTQQQASGPVINVTPHHDDEEPR